jgi:hypothetical protein
LRIGVSDGARTVSDTGLNGLGASWTEAAHAGMAGAMEG